MFPTWIFHSNLDISLWKHGYQSEHNLCVATKKLSTEPWEELERVSRLWVKSQWGIGETVLMTLFFISQRTTHVSLLKYTLQATRDGSCLIKPDKASLKMRLGETHHVDCRAAQFSLESRGSCVLFRRGRAWDLWETRQHDHDQQVAGVK